jgi:hypothetical protein
LTQCGGHGRLSSNTYGGYVPELEEHSLAEVHARLELDQLEPEVTASDPLRYARMALRTVVFRGTPSTIVFFIPALATTNWDAGQRWRCAG